MSDRKHLRLGLIGFGEVGSTLGKGFKAEGLREIASYDKYAFDGPFAGLIQRRRASHRSRAPRPSHRTLPHGTCSSISHRRHPR